jgi:hypothetical protein
MGSNSSPTLIAEMKVAIIYHFDHTNITYILKYTFVVYTLSDVKHYLIYLLFYFKNVMVLYAKPDA